MIRITILYTNQDGETTIPVYAKYFSLERFDEMYKECLLIGLKGHIDCNNNGIINSR